MIGKEAVRILTRMITNWTAYGQVWPEYGTNPLTAFNWRQVSASRKDFSLLRWSNAVALYSFKEGNASHKNGNWSTLMLEIKNHFRIHVQFCTFMYSFKEGNASHKNGNWSTLMLSSFGNKNHFRIHAHAIFEGKTWTTLLICTSKGSEKSISKKNSHWNNNDCKMEDSNVN